MSSQRDLVAKKMAQLIRAGAVLTSYSCPACGNPLLRLRSGENYCASCDKPVVIVKSDAEEREVSMRYGFVEIMGTLFEKLMDLNDELRGTHDLDRLNEILRSMLLVLEAYGKLSELVKGSPGGTAGGQQHRQSP